MGIDSEGREIWNIERVNIERVKMDIWRYRYVIYREGYIERE